MMELPSLLHAQDDNLSQMQGLLAEEFDLLTAHRALAVPALRQVFMDDRGRKATPAQPPPQGDFPLTNSPTPTPPPTPTPKHST